MLQTLLQSYQNVSNSQQRISANSRSDCCKRFCKVIKMLAIHNPFASNNIKTSVANAFAKLSKCQQFTTQLQRPSNHHQLQTLLQSYQNVSNSQLFRRCSILPKGCKRFCKVIKMLAIHNIDVCRFFSLSVANAFAKLSKCQQFTTAPPS